MVFSVACNGWNQPNLPSVLSFLYSHGSHIESCPQTYGMNLLTSLKIHNSVLCQITTPKGLKNSCELHGIMPLWSGSSICPLLESQFMKRKKHPLFSYSDVIFNLLLNYMLNIQMWLEGILASALSPDSDHLSYSV